MDYFLNQNPLLARTPIFTFSELMVFWKLLKTCYNLNYWLLHMLLLALRSNTSHSPFYFVWLYVWWVIHFLNVSMQFLKRTHNSKPHSKCQTSQIMSVMMMSADNVHSTHHICYPKQNTCVTTLFIWKPSCTNQLYTSVHNAKCMSHY